MAGRRSTGAAHDGWGTGRGPGPGADGVPGRLSGPRPGDEVAGVRLTALIGRGGAGTVWSGTETASGARVALKLLDRPTAGHEAALLDALRHPHVLPLRRVVADPPALVTDLAAGGSLADQVAARGSLVAGEVVTVLAPLADALAALHARGVVHGDVTATNILFLDRGRPVLADLGVAGLAGDGVPWATPGYAAPEVLAGGRPGPAADVHGLGAAAWLALTGAVPPPEPDRLPLGLLAPDCPPALLAAVTAALDPDPAGRPAPGDLAVAARSACPGLAVSLVPAAARGVRADEAVTYRVREAAAAEGSAPAARGPRRLLGRLDSAGGRVLSHVRRATPSVRPRPGMPAVPVLRPSLVAAVVPAVVPVLVALVGLVLVGLVLTVAGPVVPGALVAAPAPAKASGAEVVRDAGTGDAGTGDAGAGDTGAGEAGAGDTGAGDAGPVDLQATVAALVDARQQALRAGDPVALDRVHDPDGTTLGEDRELVAAGPVDVTYEVVAVRPVAGSARSAQVELRTTTGGATTAEQVVLELAPGEDGWRVRSVSR